MPCIRLVVLLLAVPSLSVAQTVDPSRTSRGTPDLSGYWEYRSTTPLQRPISLTGKAVLTPEKMADYLVERHAAIGRERDLQLNADWWQPGDLTARRTSLVVDSPDGRIPQLSADAQARRARLGPAIRMRLADGAEDRERYERCIMGRTVPLLAVARTDSPRCFRLGTILPFCTSRTLTCGSSHSSTTTVLLRRFVNGLEAREGFGRATHSSLKQ